MRIRRRSRHGKRPRLKESKVFRVAVIEDDKTSLLWMKELLRRFEEEIGSHFEIAEFRDGYEIVENYTADYDFLFMDIELPLLNGMSAAEEIRRRDADVGIIFVTSSTQYAIRGYRVGALDYLVKPVDYATFAETMRRALAHRRVRDDRFLMLNVRAGVRRKIHIRNIRYVEVRDHDLTYHLIDGNIKTRGTFREAEQRLTPEGFFRCNKGILVNLAYVDGVERQDICVGSDRIQLGNSRKRAFMDALNRYMM
jgi:DNA-binding LytR/AlgR family response regulator